MSDQFTRWTCAKCGEAGIDSWNKAIFDGTAHGPDVPNPWIMGMDCNHCCWPVVVMYTTPDAAPRAIYGPIGGGTRHLYGYETEAFKQIEATPGASIELMPHERRDADWSRGCLAAKAQMQ